MSGANNAKTEKITVLTEHCTKGKEFVALLYRRVYRRLEMDVIGVGSPFLAATALLLPYIIEL